MSIVTILSDAKCKHCAYIIKDRRKNKCDNKKSKRFETQVKLNDFVCDKWSLTREDLQTDKI